MIVTSTSAATRNTDGGAEILVRCLARRGMLHSECEAYDFVRLDPWTPFEGGCRAGAEQAWYVIDGQLSLDGGDALATGELLLVPEDCEPRAVAGSQGARLVTVSVLAAAVAARLPHRAPEMTSVAEVAS
jgi:hypothetical protein